jgi:hypothetical protein
MARESGLGQGRPRDHSSPKEGQDLVTTEQEESFLSYSFELIVEEVDQLEDHILNTSLPTSPPAKVSKFKGPDFQKTSKIQFQVKRGETNARLKVTFSFMIDQIQRFQENFIGSVNDAGVDAPAG